MKHEHLLVMRFSALGDVAMTVPVIWALAQQYPQLRITVLSRSISRTFFDDLAPNVNFMSVDFKKEYRGMKGLNALYRRLVAKQFTAVADLHDVLRSKYLRLRFKMGLYPVAHINKHRKERHQLVAHEPKKVLQQLPTSFENYAAVFAQLGYPIDPKYLCFHSYFMKAEATLNPEKKEATLNPEKKEATLNPEKKEATLNPGKAEATLKAEGTLPTQRATGNLNMLPKSIGPKRSWEHWIGIAPFATYEGKIYPLPLMEQVIEMLLKQYPKARLFLFGRGEKEEAVFKEWEKRWKACLYVGDHTENIFQELIVMSHLDVMLSMDSSNMHMASLTATPVVSIWGATHPFAGFMGWNQSMDNVIQIDELKCRPCSIYGKKPCMRGDYACMHHIKPETVVKKINEVLAQKDSNSTHTINN